jgi:hypothetical protein
MREVGRGALSHVWMSTFREGEREREREEGRGGRGLSEPAGGRAHSLGQVRCLLEREQWLSYICDEEVTGEGDHQLILSLQAACN